MGRLINGINGPIQGKVGAVIGSSWKGIPYLKGPYQKRTKNISNKEKANREKFTVSQKWLKPLLEFVREGFRGYTPTNEGFGAAKSYLLKNALEGTEPPFRINPSLMQVSYGDLPLPADMAVELKADGELQFSWDASTIDRARRYDQVMMLAYNVEGRKARYVTYGNCRHAGNDTLKIIPGTGTWHLYMAFIAADRTSQSHSVYMGEVAP